jgi:hypothetical protein
VQSAWINPDELGSQPVASDSHRGFSSAEPKTVDVAEDPRTGQLSGAPRFDPAITRTIVLAVPNARPNGHAVRCEIELYFSCRQVNYKYAN